MCLHPKLIHYIHPQQLQILTSTEKFSHAQVADDEPHDGGLVQAGADAVGQGQLLGQLVEHL